MKIGFIGAGKVGCSLGKLFAVHGLPVTGYYSRHRESAQEAATFTDSSCYETMEEVLRDSDALFITVTDGAISSVFQELSACDMKDKYICHCSGAMSAEEAFGDLSHRGAFGYSIHPLFPVSSRFEAYKGLADAFFCLEGDPSHLEEWSRILEPMVGGIRIIDGKNKVKYHGACAIASNLVCGLLQESQELLMECGFTEEEARGALGPLVRSNVERCLLVGGSQALTGPVERCDLGTVKKHLEILESPEEKALYSSLSMKLVEMGQKRHPESDYQPIKDLLLREGGFLQGMCENPDKNKED